MSQDDLGIAYEYLIKSIDQFINQEELIGLMEKNNFHKCFDFMVSSGGKGDARV